MELDERTTDSDIISRQEGKTMDELDTTIAEYNCNVLDNRLQAIMLQQELEGNHLQVIANAYQCPD
jgi:hypothetical protein